MKRQGENSNAHYRVKEATWKVSLLYDPMYMMFWKRQNYGDSEMINGGQGLWGKITGGEERNVRAVKLLCVMPWWWRQVIADIFKPVEYTTSKVIPKVNHGLWVKTVSPCSSSSVRHVPLWGEESSVENKEGHMAVEKGIYGKSLYTCWIVIGT